MDFYNHPYILLMNQPLIEKILKKKIKKEEIRVFIKNFFKFSSTI